MSSEKYSGNCLLQWKLPAWKEAAVRLMTAARCRVLPALGCAAALAASLSAAGPEKVSRPSLSLKASPAVGFAPVRMVFTAELKGGDPADLYCPAIEWNWGDDTKSETRTDCEPFEPGKSEIKRRYVIAHSFDDPGAWKVELRLKQKNKVVASGSTTVTVRPGLKDGRHPLDLAWPCNSDRFLKCSSASTSTPCRMRDCTLP